MSESGTKDVLPCLIISRVILHGRGRRALFGFRAQLVLVKVFAQVHSPHCLIWISHKNLALQLQPGKIRQCGLSDDEAKKLHLTTPQRMLQLTDTALYTNLQKPMVRKQSLMENTNEARNRSPMLTRSRVQVHCSSNLVTRW